MRQINVRLRGQRFVVKMLIPNSAASKIIGRDGCHAREMAAQTGCRTSISRRNPGIQERVVLLVGEEHGLATGTKLVARKIQDDPHLAEHMHFSYDVELPLGSWDCCKTGPMEPRAELLSPEVARTLPKRNLVEYLHKAAPREILVRYRLLGSMRKILKMKTHEQVMEVVEQTWQTRRPGEGHMATVPASPAERSVDPAGMLPFYPVGLLPLQGGLSEISESKGEKKEADDSSQTTDTPSRYRSDNQDEDIKYPGLENDSQGVIDCARSLLDRAKDQAKTSKKMDCEEAKTAMGYVAATMMQLLKVVDAEKSDAEKLLEQLNIRPVGGRTPPKVGVLAEAWELLKEQVLALSVDHPDTLNFRGDLHRFAYQWLAKTALMDDLQKLLNTFLISSFLKGTGNPRDRKEALPIPFAILVKWEEKIMEQKTDDWLTLLLGGFLLATWASLRFADLQRTEVSNFSLASNALRGLCRLTKTTRAGQPFAVSLGGFTTVIPRTGWVLCWLRAVHRAYHRSLPFKPDFVIPVLNHYQRPSFHSPLAYAGALRALRWAIQTPWTSRLLTPMEAQGYTLHSLKVTFLSAAAQLRLPSRARRLQGHHVQGSMQLYSRDDTVDAVWLQQEICKQVRGGWRATRPLQRGGQTPVPEPPFQVPTRLHPEHFDLAPEPELAMFQATDHFLDDIEPISLVDSSSSSDSSSSCSDSEDEAPAPREVQRTLESMRFVQNGPSGCCHIAVEAPVDVQACRTIGHMDQTWTTKCGASLRPSATIIKFDQVQWPCKRGA
eukprot:symbB.v1.2.039802.t1/scaffold6793.1/size15506/1